jgi:metal-sulfur cluster biosynthetic enzyme
MPADLTPATAMPDEAAIRDALRLVDDPEVGMNIVDLGLVYRVDVNGDKVVIEMTMTSPACPMSGMILDEVEAVLDKILPSTAFLEILLVWTPPWDPSMMSPAAKARLGW